MLTDLAIKNLMRPDKRPDKRKEVPDGKIGGLYFVIQPSGAASWALRYRASGKPAKLTLGSYPALDLGAARKRAQKAAGDIAVGKDPAAEKRAAREAQKAERTDDTVRHVAEQFKRRYVATKIGEGWGKEIDRMFRVEILPVIGDKRIGDVRKQDINRILDALVDRGSPITANRCLAIMRKFFNWAADEREIVERSPVEGIKAPASENSRDRHLSEDEIKPAWRAFDNVGWPFGPIAKLLLLTGARRDEIAEARWNEVDLVAKTLTIAKERSKNGVAHEIPLSDMAVEIVKGLPRIEPKRDANGKLAPGYLFTTTGATAVSGFSKARAAIDEAMLEAMKADAEHRGENPEKVTVPAHWTLHDLRRTVATNLQKLNVRLEVTEAVLAHISGSRAGIVGIYQRHDWADEKRAALDAWSRRLAQIVSGEADRKVVAFVRK